KKPEDLSKHFKVLMTGPGETTVDEPLKIDHPGEPLNKAERVNSRPTPDRVVPRAPQPFELGSGDVVIAAITSCTNTSNPGVLLAAGLLAKKAVEKGLKVEPHIKTSLAPGSRVVTEYLTKTGLMPYLDQLGFNLAAYGCTTCIGNSGDLAPEINEAITSHDLVCAAVLSGNRNFEARIQPNIRANFLASPPLVVAYALAGSMLKNLKTDPVGMSKDDRQVFIVHIRPSAHGVKAVVKLAMGATTLRKQYPD